MKPGRGLALSVFAVVALVGLVVWQLDRDPPDGPTAHRYEDNTVWAADFTDRSFRDIAVGMVMRDVVVQLGQPLQRSGDLPDNGCWHYTVPRDGKGSFRCRLVLFQNGRVRETQAHIFID
ncbi:MAG: hypothetical protein AAF581_10240 [Planctomycetota bacterium]